jgi:peptide/nickel transport system ATP-binding protein
MRASQREVSAASAQGDMPLLRALELIVEFPVPGRQPVRAVNGVSLEVNRGEIVTLVGESGCGKSVTVRSLFGLLPPPGRLIGGRVIFDGLDLSGMREEQIRKTCRGMVGYVFQDPMTYLNPVMSVGAQVAEAMTGHARSARNPDARDRICELLSDLGIGDPTRVLESYPHQLSGGMRQRIMIAMALSRTPKLLILDEPTTALDVTVQAQIVDLLKRVQRRAGVGVLFVTHDFGLVAEMADRVYVMYSGQVVEEGPVRRIFSSSRHPYTRGLIDCVLTTGERKESLRTIPGEVPNPRAALTGCRFASRCLSKKSQCEVESPSLTLEADGQVRCWRASSEIESPAIEAGGSGYPGLVTGTGASWGARNEVQAHSKTAELGRPAGEATIRVESVTKSFPVRGGAFGGSKALVRAVNGVSLEIANGELFALVGESGSGKSTLGRMVVGLDEPDKGCVTVGGRDAAEWTRNRAMRPMCQMVFQDPYSSLNPRKLIRESITQPLANFGFAHDAKSLAERAAELLEQVGLSPAGEYLDRYPHELSGGQRQRVVIARALAPEPLALVADEAVSSLDMSTRTQILGLLRELCDAVGLSILLITHDLAVVSSVADRTGVMYLGRLYEIGPTEAVISQAKHPYSRALISAVPLPDPVKARQREQILMQGEAPSPVNLPSGCFFNPRCQHATELCRSTEPQWAEIEEGHFVACHLYD